LICSLDCLDFSRAIPPRHNRLSLRDMPRELQSAVLVRRLRSLHRAPRAASGIRAAVGGTASFRSLGILGQKSRSGGQQGRSAGFRLGRRIVSESTLASRINAARRVIGDTGEQQRLIRTIIGKGVRFVGTVREQQDTVQSTAPPGVPRLSVVVLSFANFANDPEQDCLADCLSPLRWPSLHPYTRIMPFCQLLKKVSYERWTNHTKLPNSDAIPLPAVFRRSNFRCRTARRVHSSY
jgi:hypothetical protein